MDDQSQIDERAIRWAFIENICTLTAVAAIIIGIYAMSRSLHCFWGLVLMLNLNAVTRKYVKL
jgi:hypothetical protein